MTEGQTVTEIYKEYSQVPNKTLLDEWWRAKGVYKLIERYFKKAPVKCYYCESYNTCKDCPVKKTILEYYKGEETDEIERRIERIPLV